jgi:hypothetical protein
MESKYGLHITATEPTPPPAKIIASVKDGLIELYNNFFNEKKYVERKIGVISMRALQELKDMGEPNVVNIFHLMNKLISQIDTLDIVTLYRAIAKILDASNKAAATNVIGDFLIEQSRLNRSLITLRAQLLRGFETQIGRVTKKLSTALRILKNFVPEGLKFEEKGQPLEIGVVDLPTRTLPESLIRRFLLSPASLRHNLTKDNWDMMFTDPTFRLRLVRLVNAWEINNSTFNPTLAEELDTIVKTFKEREKTNVPYLEQGESIAPSTPTTTIPENINLFDSFLSGKSAK